ncbi:DUF305 domain-containing protein [Microlunatus soli]|nr:DUF305 domain-containing protein [Microlunatus soli]
MHPVVTIKRALLPSIMAATLAVTGCSTTDGGPDAGPAGSSTSPSASATTASHNAADVMFAQMMIPHHRQAVEMSDLLLDKDISDPRVEKLARQIKAAQLPEIDTMTGWLTDFGVSRTPPAGHDHGDMGMMDEAAMEELRSASGDRATTLYLSGMIEHHRGAVTMAQEERDGGRYPAARKLARTIITSQRQEIATMQRILDEK